MRFPSVLVITMTALTRKGTSQMWFQKEPWQCGGKQASHPKTRDNREGGSLCSRISRSQMTLVSFLKGPTFTY